MECSAKSGLGIDDVLAAIVDNTPAPALDQEKEKLRCLIFDSYYDPYRGVITYFRVVQVSCALGARARACTVGFVLSLTCVCVCV